MIQPKLDKLEKFILGISETAKIDAAVFMKFQRQFCKDNATSFLKKDELLRVYQKLVKNGTIKQRGDLEKILQMKNVRSQSGIAVVSVLTKPYDCPGACIFCPTETGVPKSYLSDEPAVMRAIANSYDPYNQVQSRLKALRDTGHIIDKISIRIIGGSWSYYPEEYKKEFINKLFQSCNNFPKNQFSKTKSLPVNQTINETASSRIVELSIETRPDMITEKEILELRNFGVTKVELGVQSLDDKILKLNKRGNNVEQIIAATKLLKESGFKVSYQMMLNLFHSDLKNDLRQFINLFRDDNFRPDHLKIYPLALVKNSQLFENYRNSEFKPYDKNELIRLIATIKERVPAYCRIERVIRDIPATSIVEGGAAISNLRQEVERLMSIEGKRCRCIRCREIKGAAATGKPELSVEHYQASGGQEYFISFEDNKHLIGFCRLRLDGQATIREIHVYGPTVAIGERNGKAQQHKNFGNLMVDKAESIAMAEGYRNIRVISGIGVRGYFKKLGYHLADTYMVKKIIDIV